MDLLAATSCTSAGAPLPLVDASSKTLRHDSLVVNAACTGFMSCWCLHGMCSSWIRCYRIPVGHPIVVSPPGVHAKINESRSQVQGPKIALTGKVCEPLHALFPT